MRMLKRLSLVVATALGICLLAPTGDAKDAGIGSTFPSPVVSLDQTGAAALTSPTLKGRDNPLYASSQCCNQNDSSCCPLGASLEETEITQSTGQQCFDLVELSAVGVSAAIGDDWIQSTSHCCNTNVKTCCSQVEPSTQQEAPLSPEPESFDLAELNFVSGASAVDDNPLQEWSHCCNMNNNSCCPDAPPPDTTKDLILAEPPSLASTFLAIDHPAISEVMSLGKATHCCNEDDDTCCPKKTRQLMDIISEHSLTWLQDTYSVSMEDLQSWSIYSASPGTDLAWLNASYCCNPITRVFTCCAPNVAEGGTGWYGFGKEIKGNSGQLVTIPSDKVYLWFDENQQARMVCLK